MGRHQTRPKLKLALTVLVNNALVDVLLKIIEDNPAVQQSIESSMLVSRKDVVKLHADT